MDHLKVPQSRPCVSIWILGKYGISLWKFTGSITTNAFLSFNGLTVLLSQERNLAHQAGCIPTERTPTSRACCFSSRVFTKHLLNNLLQKFPEINVRVRSLYPFFIRPDIYPSLTQHISIWKFS